MIAIIDYGMGNLRSVQKALEKVGARAEITQSPDVIRGAAKVVLPGVGAIKPAVEKLKALKLTPVIEDVIADGKPFLGICLGLQLLFERSDESGRVEGLGILKGPVERFRPAPGATLKVPQMGWNRLKIRQKNCPLFYGVADGAYAYFCHSYYVNPVEKDVIAVTTDYGVDFTSAVCRGNLFGVQFHPEKSQTVGLKILENFMKVES